MTVTIDGTTGVSLVQDGVVTAADLASGAITGAALPAGSVLQVVTAYSTNDTVVSSTSYTDTTLYGTITPSSTSSSILILISQNCQIYRAQQAIEAQVKLVRGSTDLFENNFFNLIQVNGQTAGLVSAGNFFLSYEDSPATTSAITYKTMGRPNTSNDSGSARFQMGNARSTITLMEIAG